MLQIQKILNAILKTTIDRLFRFFTPKILLFCPKSSNYSSHAFPHSCLILAHFELTSQNDRIGKILRLTFHKKSIFSHLNHEIINKTFSMFSMTEKGIK